MEVVLRVEAGPPHGIYRTVAFPADNFRPLDQQQRTHLTSSAARERKSARVSIDEDAKLLKSKRYPLAMLQPAVSAQEARESRASRLSEPKDAIYLVLGITVAVDITLKGFPHTRLAVSIPPPRVE